MGKLTSSDDVRMDGFGGALSWLPQRQHFLVHNLFPKSEKKDDRHTCYHYSSSSSITYIHSFIFIFVIIRMRFFSVGIGVGIHHESKKNIDGARSVSDT
mmetsp:Transcript_24926/g.40800  ORF Transcript_24926/g.40800 Transcript_24926/m.40800 type:complete len:99 (-) Transcript_24926:427-723(-)